MFAIDLDGTTVDTAVNARRIVSEKLGITLEPARTHMRDLYDGVPPDMVLAANRLYADGFREDAHGMYSAATPMPHAADVLNWLARRNLLSAYITYRPASVAAGTLTWLKRHNFPTAPVLHADDGQNTKAALMRSVRASVLVDDDPGTIRQVVDAGYAGILFGQPPASFYSTAQAGTVLATDWPALGRLLAHMPLDYRERYERGF